MEDLFREPNTVTTSVSACWLTAGLPDSRELAQYCQPPNSPTPWGIALQLPLADN